MSTDQKLVLFHSPQTRSSGTLFLLEELGAAYDLHILNMKAGENREPAYLKINPLGKVPALLHGEALITEQVAIAIYLGDLFPEAGLTPAIGDPRRGPYLRWLVYYGSCFEPAIVDRFLKHEPAPPSTSPYGDFDTMLSTLVAEITDKPYLLGDAPTVADMLWGTALNWVTMFGMVERTAIIGRYIDRITSRQAYVDVMARDAVLAAEHEAATNAGKG
ncbi:glutathione S-transferase family protein [Mangrovitalea sediminis]|uniref:glutathione S-transferase family protein n=1 Tax=Mangrovitalea sediminis TaxID=1982043 RepID=UPI000BE4F613|nr:glutathione S-transferase family protein [Mangrovitalea sediminis]